MATTYYVNSVGGDNSSAYSSWAKGAAKLETVMALAAAGDTIYIASDHAETTAGAIT